MVRVRKYLQRRVHFDTAKPKGSEFFKIPRGFTLKTQWKWSYIIPSPEQIKTARLRYIPLSKTGAAGDPRFVADHVIEMQRLLERGVKVPPVTVTQTQSGRYSVEDGNTRVLALKRMNVPYALAVVIQPSSYRAG